MLSAADLLGRQAEMTGLASLLGGPGGEAMVVLGEAGSGKTALLEAAAARAKDSQVRVLPFEKTGKRLPGLIADMELVAVEGGPHAIPWTHSDQVNSALLGFLGHPAA